MTFSPDGAHAYVANGEGGTVSVIATATNTVVATVPVGSGPSGVALTPDGARVYVANCRSNTISVIAAASNTVVDTVQAGECPIGVAVSPDGARAYVTNTQNGTISVVATATNAVVATVIAGNGPYAVAFSPDGGRVYVTDAPVNRLLVIDPTPTIAVAPASLPGGTVGAAYTQALTASGGADPYTFAVTTGALPTGLRLAPDGTLSGTPTAGGTFGFTVTATEAGSYTSARPYTVTIGPATIALAPVTLPAGAIGAAYSQQLTASGGTAPYNFAVMSGTLPAGLRLSPTGTLAGTPTAVGSATFTVRATDSSTGTGSPYTSERPYTVTITRGSQTITFGTPAGSTAYTVGQQFTIGATASSGLPVAFAASGVCTSAGTTVTTTGAGVCTVTASQPGNASYAAAPDVARTFAVAAAPIAQSTVRASAQGNGTISPAGATTYPTSGLATYAAAPGAGQLFLGWTLDGQYAGFASPLTFAVNDNRTLVARFAPRPAFSDVPTSAVAWDAITHLAARGVINGYGDGTYGPTDPVQRAQIAALIVRAMGWDTGAATSPAPFTDLGNVDAELARAIAILTARGIARGYGDGTYNPTGEVTHAQAISLIARSMVQAGYWTQVTAAEDDGTVYPNILAASPHRLDILTFVKYAGAIPDRPTGQPWTDWEGPASRGWTAQVLWQAYRSYFGVDRVP